MSTTNLDLHAMQVLEDFRAKLDKAERHVERLYEVSGEAIEALDALATSASERVIFEVAAAPRAFWEAVISEARWVCDYIEKDGNGSCFEFGSLRKQMEELREIADVALEKTEKRVVEASKNA